MEDRAKSFFVLLMAAFLLGVLIHLVIPIEIVVNVTQKIEEVYNGYKIQVEQNTVRGIAYLNSLAITNQIQIYENVRSLVIRLFETGSRYEVTEFSRINMMNAYLLANGNLNVTKQQLKANTMWFIPTVKSYEQMNDVQKWMMQQFSQIEEYMGAIDINNEFHEGLQAIEITINYEGQQLYFQYPSTVNSRFKNLNANVLSEDFNKTVLNFKTSKRYQTLINSKDQLKACSSILDNNEPFAVVCLKLNIEAVMKKISKVLKVPDFQLSTSRYYLLKPLYKFQGDTYPQIVSYFTSENLNEIHFPTSQHFTQLTQNLQQLFNSQDNYLLNVQQHEKSKTYYITPIQTYNNIDTKQIILYFVVVNDFAKSNLKSASHYKQFFVIMIVPSTIFLLIAALAMGFNMRPLFAKLRYYSVLMNQYCLYIGKNDLTLQVNQEGETSDFVQIFKNLKYLNLLNKLSTIKYIKVNFNQRILKLLQALQLFDQLGYNTDNNKVNIYQNLAYCYQRTGQQQNAIKYLKQSINSTIKQLGGIESIQYFQKEEPSQISEQKRKNKKSIIRHLRYKIYKLCVLLYEKHVAGDLLIMGEIGENMGILRKFLSFTSISVEYVYSYILWSICCLENGASKFEMQQQLANIQTWVKRLQQSKSKINKLLPIQILKSYKYYLKGLYLKREQHYLKSYQCLIMALDGHRFDPNLHKKIKKEIKEIMQICKINTQEIDNIFNYLQQDKIKQCQFDGLDDGLDGREEVGERRSGGQQRQFIFMSDVSNPGMSIGQFNQWKGYARKMAEYIFDTYINSSDRVSISQFCNDTKVICNLIQKSKNESMLRKQLMSSIKARYETIYSHMIPNLRKTIERTKNLKKQKIFIVFLKEGIQIQTSNILEQISKMDNYKVIFIVKDLSQRINFYDQGFYVVSFLDFHFLDIILGTKSIKKADNIVYLF